MRTIPFSALLVCLACIGMAWGQSPYPDDPGVLWQQATLYRDAWGVPHVYADNPRALAFAFGYAQAQDHLPQMLLAYRVANGRAAEVFGEAYAASDEFAIRMGHADLAADALRAVDPVTRDLCEGFALGANAWWVQHPNAAPAWADGVRPADILALLHCYLMSFAPFDHPTAWRRGPAAITGNAWAVAPSKSQSGNAMLVINPHANYNSVFSWYEAHIVCGDLNVAGATLFGLPVIIVGHNASLGWALTPNTTDMADVYEETPPKVKRGPSNIDSPQLDPELLFYLSTFADARAFYVARPGGMDERIVRKLETPRGPVIAEHDKTFYSYRIGGYYDFGTIRQLVEMGRAQDLATFKSALAMQQLPCFHVVYADRAGNIFYLYNTKTGVKADPTPRRPPPSPEQARNPLYGLATGRANFEGGSLVYQNRQQIGPYQGAPEEIQALLDSSGPPPWTQPLDASDPVYAWGAMVPIDQLPYLENPAAGYVQACGTPPWYATQNSMLNPWDWPSWLVRDRDSFRAKRVRQLLEGGPRSFNDLQTMLFDVVSPFALEAVPVILEAARLNPNSVAAAHPDLPAALAVLESWKGTADVDSTAMTFFHVWWSALRTQPFPMLDSEDELYMAVLSRTPEMMERVLTAANDATKLLRNQYQSVSVPWGAVHQIHRGNRVEQAAGALTGESILVSEDRQIQDGQWPVTYGYGFGMVVEFGDTPRASSLVPFGASEYAESPHYDDQLTLFTQNRLKPTRYLTDDVQRNAVSVFGMSPVLRASGIVGHFQLHAEAPLFATMNSDVSAPAPLPDGLVPFTVFATAATDPPDVAARLAMEIRIPEVICAVEYLSQLQIYRHDNSGWNPLENQRLDAQGRTLAGVSDRAGTFAVLGPAEYRSAQIADAVEEEANESTTFGGVLARLQPTPPTSSLITDSSRDQPVLVDPKTWQPVDVPMRRDRGWIGSTAPPDAPLVPRSAPGPVEEQPEPDTTAGAPATPPAELPASENKPAAPKPPVEVAWVPDAPAIQTPDIQLSDSIRGKEIEFRPPTIDALFRVTSKRVVEAQLRLTNAPPADLPAGMAAFTQFAEVMCTNTTPRPEVAVLVSVPRSKCADENIQRLGVYAYDPEGGWQQLSGQLYSAETRSFSALDSPPRLYAVLGPADCLVR